MWNDTDIPLAYLITFRSYGTWLHGNPRGSVDRSHNRYLSPYVPPDPKRLEDNLRKLSHEIVIFSAKQRESIEAAIRETCVVRKWFLHHQRSNKPCSFGCFNRSYNTGTSAKRFQSLRYEKNAPRRLLGVRTEPLGG
jgi:hypothetical protein